MAPAILNVEGLNLEVCLVNNSLVVDVVGTGRGAIIRVLRNTIYLYRSIYRAKPYYIYISWENILYFSEKLDLLYGPVKITVYTII